MGATASRPNVLLFVLDTARADAFEPYGAPKGSTPVIADLARCGLVGTQMYATGNWTLPSHASLFTGLLPRRIGLGSGASPAAAMSQWSDKVLAEVLRRAGYTTFAISSNPWISKAQGFDAGFDSFTLVKSHRQSPHSKGVRQRARWRLQAMHALADNGLAAVSARLTQWLAERKKAPFFGFVNLMECHSPYLPPRPYDKSSFVQRWRSASDARRFQTPRAIYEASSGDRNIPYAAMRRMHRQYQSAVRMMDDWIGRMLDYLEQAGVLEDTVVVVTSDHGEHFGEGQRFGHVLSIHNTLIRIPFVSSGPVRLPIGPLSSLADVPAAIAAAVDIPHPWEEPTDRPMVFSQDDGIATFHEPAARALMSAWSIPHHIEEMIRTPRDCVIDGRFKLIRAGTEHVLHDLEADPEENVDVSDSHPETVERMRSALDDAGRFHPPSQTMTANTEQELDDDLAERLSLLGYL